jgi:hypothetical protein
MFKTIPQTREQIIAEEINALNAAAEKLFREFRDGYANLYWRLWQNGRCTPDEMLAALGTDALPLFLASQKAAAFLASMDAGYVAPQTDWTFAVNADGSVTAVAPTPEPEGVE